MSGPAKKMAIICASGQTIDAFLVPIARALTSDWAITLICYDKPKKIDIPGVRYISLRIERKVNLLQDIAGWFALVNVIHSERFTMIYSITPKAGLLAMTAGALCRTEIRWHTFTGQVWVTRAGFSRVLLKLADLVTASAATSVFADSRSQAAFLAQEGIVSTREVHVNGGGSVSGVDTSRFRPVGIDDRKMLRASLGAAEQCIAILFLGRINRDKGIIDLFTAYADLRSIYPDTELWIAGPDEEGIMRTHPQVNGVRYLGPTSEPESIIAASDILCLPSYREGFGTVVIEAAACKVCAAVSRIYGLTDAVIENETGVFFEPKNAPSIRNALAMLVSDAKIRAKLSAGAYRRAVEVFDQGRVVRKITQSVNSAQNSISLNI